MSERMLTIRHKDGGKQTLVFENAVDIVRKDANWSFAGELEINEKPMAFVYKSDWTSELVTAEEAAARIKKDPKTWSDSPANFKKKGE